MKKHFCDLCGNEMEKPGEANRVVNIVRSMAKDEGTRGRVVTRDFTVTVKMEPSARATGEHVDICSNCLWDAVDSITPVGGPDGQ